MKSIIFTILPGIIAFSLNATASEKDINCSSKGFPQLYIFLEPSAQDSSFYNAEITGFTSPTYSIPGEPMPVLGEYEMVTYDRGTGSYRSNDGRFELAIGNPSHLFTRAFNMNVNCQ
jgi:hypothetical protein